MHLHPYTYNNRTNHRRPGGDGVPVARVQDEERSGAHHTHHGQTSGAKGSAACGWVVGKAKKEEEEV
jgi:hypothetical protein